MRELIDTVAAAITPELDSLGLELFDVQLSGAGPTRVLQVMIDREGGVDLEAITSATERISRLLDTRDELSGPFALEVSSPGIERPLRTPAHFQRAVGELVSVKTRGEQGETHRHRGTLAAADDHGIRVDDLPIAYDDIQGARTVFEWGAASKPARGSKKVKA